LGAALLSTLALGSDSALRHGSRLFWSRFGSLLGPAPGSQLPDFRAGMVNETHFVITLPLCWGKKVILLVFCYIISGSGTVLDCSGTDFLVSLCFLFRYVSTKILSLLLL